jgi:chromosome partitioning protein
MRIITFANRKGGVGKTTSVLAIAHRLAQLGYQTLLIDADPQGNASSTIAGLPAVPGSLAAALATANGLSPQINAATPNLYCVTAGEDLTRQEKLLGQEMDYGWFFRNALQELASTLAGGQARGAGNELMPVSFDFVLIDTSPYLGTLAVAAMVASEAVFIPLQPNYFNSEGLTKVVEMVGVIRRNFNPHLRIGGIFFTKYARTYRKALHHQYARALEADPVLGKLVMQQTIRENVALDESQAGQQPIYDWAPSSNGAADYRALTEEFLTCLNSSDAA